MRLNVSTEKTVITIQWILSGIFGIILVLQPPAKGYELSLYSSIFAPFLLISFLQIFLLMTPLYISFNTYTPLKLIPPFVITLTNILLIPVYKGYTFYGRGDTLTHLGIIKDLSSSNLIEGIGYPAIHLITTHTSIILNIGLKQMMMIILIIYPIAYILFIYLLVSAIFTSRRAIYMTTLLSLIISFERVQQLAPFSASLFLLPFILYILYRMNNNVRWIGLFFIVSISSVTYHIISSMLPVLIISSYMATVYIVRRNPPGPSDIRDVKVEQLFASPRSGILLSILSITWAIYAYQINIGRISLVVIRRLPLLGTTADQTGGGQVGGAVANSPSKSVFAQYIEIITQADIPVHYLAEVLFFQRSSQLFFYFTPAILISIIIYHIYMHDLKVDELTYTLIFTYIFTGFLSIFLLFLPLGFSYSRFTRVVVMICILVLGIYSSLELKTHVWNKKYSRIAITIVIGVILLSSTISVHKSPMTGYSNSQITQQELNAGGWAMENGNLESSGSRIYSNTLHMDRIEDAIYGKKYKTDIHSAIIRQSQIPDEFGYRDHDRIEQAILINNSIIIFTKHDRIHYKIYPTALHRTALSYHNKSIIKLSYDPSVNQIYENGEASLYGNN